MLLKSTAFLFSATFAASAASLAHAQDLDSMSKAMQLGTVIGSEDYCGLTYDQTAIAAWIEENVDPGDMSFTDYLDVGAESEKMEQEDRSPSAKTAHCASITRTAKHYGFIAG